MCGMVVRRHQPRHGMRTSYPSIQYSSKPVYVGYTGSLPNAHGPQTGARLRVLERHQDMITGLSWLPDGTGFVSGCLDHQIIIWASFYNPFIFFAHRYATYRMPKENCAMPGRGHQVVLNASLLHQMQHVWWLRHTYMNTCVRRTAPLHQLMQIVKAVEYSLRKLPHIFSSTI